MYVYDFSQLHLKIRVPACWNELKHRIYLQMKELRAKEIANGRLAMVATFGCLIQVFVHL